MTVPQLAERLRHADGSVRMRAAMDAGASRDPEDVALLVERSGIEPDFFVRDMLTWALTRYPADATVPRLIEELTSPFPQARSQALHTLTKLADARALPAVTGALVHDEEHEVARAAWRLAVVLVPEGGEAALAADLASELGRRPRESWRGLSRALVALGEDARPPLERAVASGAFLVRVHARATLRLLEEPEHDFGLAVEAAEREAAGT